MLLTVWLLGAALHALHRIADMIDTAAFPLLFDEEDEMYDE